MGAGRWGPRLLRGLRSAWDALAVRGQRDDSGRAVGVAVRGQREGSSGEC